MNESRTIIKTHDVIRRMVKRLRISNNSPPAPKRKKTGGRRPMISEEQCLNARLKMRTGRCSLTMLARECRISYRSMWRAVTGETFQHLPHATKIIKHRVCISDEVLRDIRDDRVNGVSTIDISKKYGYSKSLIELIIFRRGKYKNY